MVRASDDVEELDPFGGTAVDHTPMTFTPVPPSGFETDTTANELLPSFDFDGSPHQAKTAVHMVPSGMREAERRPAAFDDLQTLVDPPSRNAGMTLDDVSAAVSHELPMESTVRFPATPAPQPAIDDDFLSIDISQENDTAVSLGDDDVMSIDDDDVVSIDDEPTIDHDPVQAARAPQPMANEGSRASTAVVRTPLLSGDPNRSQQGVSSMPAASGATPLFSQPMDQATTSVIQVPSIVRPDNEALRQNAMLSAGGATFVGRIDPALLKATISQNDEPELMLTGGLASDGTYSPPQDSRDVVPSHLEGPTDVYSLQLADEGTRRAPNPLQAGLGDRPDERLRRPTTPIEVQGTNRAVRAVTTFGLSLALLALAVFALVRSGQLDTAVLRDPERIVRGDGGIEGATGILGVQPIAMRSVLYPTVHGKILVFTGDVKNTSAQPVTNLEVIAEVRKQDGTVLSEAREPLGLALSVAELSRLETPEAAHRAFTAKASAALTIAPGERVPFMVVISPAPRELRSGRHFVHLTQGAPPPQVAAPALPALAPAPAPAPANRPIEGSVAPANGEGEPDTIGETKARAKAKRMKMKRRLRDPAEGAAEPAEQ